MRNKQIFKHTNNKHTHTQKRKKSRVPPKPILPSRRWVQSQTDGRVVGAVTEAVSDAVTGSATEQPGAVEGLAVVAVYFSGQWLHQFQPNLTFDKGLFYPSSESRSDQALVFILLAVRRLGFKIRILLFKIGILLFKIRMLVFCCY